jgi:type I restriction enzyme M protein
MSFFHAYLSDTGRAGIVMSSQSSSAGSDEAKVRQAMIKTGDVDVMIAIRSNFFYTRSVPCELWFFDKGKPEAMRDKVLMIDARQIFNKVTRKIFDFTPEQQKNISSIVWLYRGQKDRFVALVAEHLTCAIEAASDMPLSGFIESAEAVLEAVPANASSEGQDLLEVLKTALNGIAETAQKLSIAAQLSDLKEAESAMAELAELAKDAIKQIDQFHKQANAAFSNENSGRNGTGRKAIKTLDEAREGLTDTLKSFRTMHGHAHWLLTRFPDAELVDVEGLVKLVGQDELEANDWSLTPGRYVGVAPEVEDEDFDFEEAMTAIHDELELLNAEAEVLSAEITSNLKDIL